MHKPEVFLVDDNQGDGLLLDLAFAEVGRTVEIVQARDGVEAFDFLRTVACHEPFPFQLIIIDLNLPRMNGLELLLGLKGLPELARVPMVILTTSPTAHERERILDLHCTLLMKPDDYGGLGAVVAQLIPYLFSADPELLEAG